MAAPGGCTPGRSRLGAAAGRRACAGRCLASAPGGCTPGRSRLGARTYLSARTCTYAFFSAGSARRPGRELKPGSAWRVTPQDRSRRGAAAGCRACAGRHLASAPGVASRACRALGAAVFLQNKARETDSGWFASVSRAYCMDCSPFTRSTVPPGSSPAPRFFPPGRSSWRSASGQRRLPGSPSGGRRR